jgi:tRNA nucleotidyltransferase (CCA-adding enzyme)
VQVVVGHANPDFDAYAATIAAMKLYPGAQGVYLGSQNRNVREFHGLHQDLLDFVELRNLDIEAIDRLVMVDTREPSRIGELGDVARDPAVEVVVYDHHPPSDDDIEDAEDRSMETGATTSILVHEIMERGVELTPLEATALLLGIHEDTGSLTYPNSTPYDAEAATYLMGVGADLEVLAQFLSRVLTSEQRALLDALLADLQLWDVHGQEVAVGFVQLSEYVDSASVVTHYLCEDMGYRVVVACMEMPDRLYVVGRSRVAEVDIADVLDHLGGGGHSQAASASMERISREQVLARVRQALEAEVRPPLTAGDIGSAPVRTVTSDTPMSEAGELMGRWGHGGLPVVDDGVLVGIVTRKDVDKASRHGLEHAPVKGFMGSGVVTVAPDMGLDELERLLTRESIGRVPVIEGGRITSIVTRKDVLRAKHGDSYLDRGLPPVGSEATERFLASVEGLLPHEARDAMVGLGRLAEERGERAHVVGGFVRDMLLGRRNLDIDVVVEGDGVAFAEAGAQRLGGRVVVHRRFGTAVLVLEEGRHVDVTSARTEYYTRPGALPTVEASSLRQDLLRRDFSINAMAACINPACFGAIADPFGGLRDLEQGSIRVLHSLSFVEDPTRVFRAARFEQRYGFQIEPSTEGLARRCTEMGLLDEVSGARIREELFEILDEEEVVPPLRRLEDFGALGVVAPDGVAPSSIPEDAERVDESLGVLGEALDPPPDRRLALLCAFAGHAAPHEAERWARWLRLARSWIDATVLVARDAREVVRRLESRWSDRPSRLYRLLEPFPPEALSYLYAIGGEACRARIERFVRDLAQVEAAVNGDDLIALGLEPSEAFSDILRRALDDRLDERAVGREAEMENLRRLVREAGAAD